MPASASLQRHWHEYSHQEQYQAWQAQPVIRMISWGCNAASASATSYQLDSVVFTAERQPIEARHCCCKVGECLLFSLPVTCANPSGRPLVATASTLRDFPHCVATPPRRNPTKSDSNTSLHMILPHQGPSEKQCFRSGLASHSTSRRDFLETTSSTT